MKRDHFHRQTDLQNVSHAQLVHILLRKVHTVYHAQLVIMAIEKDYMSVSHAPLEHLIEIKGHSLLKTAVAVCQVLIRCEVVGCVKTVLVVHGKVNHAKSTALMFVQLGFMEQDQVQVVTTPALSVLKEHLTIRKVLLFVKNVNQERTQMNLA